MDVLVSSNVERFLYHMSGENTSLVSTLMEELKEDGRYEIDRSILNIMDFMKAYYANEKEVNEKILTTLLNEKYLIDTHTAVASVAYDKYLKETNDRTKTLIDSTASPYKFSKDILKALEVDTNNLNDFEIMNKLQEITSVPAPKNLSSLKNKKIRFDEYSKKEDILNNIKKLHSWNRIHHHNLTYYYVL